MPVVDKLAAEYQDQVEFIAVAWRSSFGATAAQAAVLMPSGVIEWGLDETEAVFSAYGIPYQPWTVLVVDGVEVDRWPGSLPEAELRQRIEALAALAA